MAGWFRISREIEDHWVWKSNEPFDKRSAWIDLILLANFKDFKTTLKGKIVYRKRGDVNTSVRHLAQRWRWDKRKVTRFLMALESDGMVHVNSTTDGTTITIENYSKWQNVSTTGSTSDGTTDSTTDGTTGAPHEKEVIKKSKKKSLKKDIYIGLPDELVYALKGFEEMRNKRKDPMTDRAKNMLINKLNQLAGDDTDLKIRILNQSIFNSWKSVYPLVEENTKHESRRTETNDPDGNGTFGGDWSDFGYV